jgi:hypothetical protein
MARLSLLLSAAAALAAALVLVPAASPARLAGPNMLTLDSDHFRVIYDGAADQPDYISQSQAGDVLGWAERSYSVYSSWGYPAPLLDADGKLDITVKTLDPRYAAISIVNNPNAGPSSGTFQLDSKNGLTFHIVANQVFQLFGWAIYSIPDQWLDLASAEWAAFKVESFNGITPTTWGESERTLDCVGDQCGYAAGASDSELAYNRSGFPGWSFFEYLAEQYGDGFVRSVWNQAASNGAGSTSLKAVDDALASKGSSLSSAFNGWITTRLAGSWTLKALQGSLPQVFASTQTGATNGPLSQQFVVVDHLAARYLAFVPGDGTAAGLCHGGTLAITVSLPANASSRPAVFVAGSTDAQPLSVNGNKASITIPWSDCTGGAPAYLSLPNASTTVNGGVFVVSATLTIDPNTIATAVGPPQPVSMPGVAIDAPTTPVAPTLELLGPQVVHLQPNVHELRMIVMADTDGTIQASLGSYALGTSAVRAGANDLRFTLPDTAVRRTAVLASNVITLTPLASTGDAGDPVSELLKVDYPPVVVKTKLKSKAKAKPKPAARKHTTHKG